MATEQIAVRLPEELLAELDALVAAGVYESRGAAVRAGVESLLAIERHRQTDRARITEMSVDEVSLVPSRQTPSAGFLRRVF